MKKSFVQTLGDHLHSEVVENSYYNDECDIDCHTPDFDAAYKYIQEQEGITKEDLGETYMVEDPDLESGNLEYTCLDLLKLTVTGDFNNENNVHSSEIANLRMCEHLFKITKGDKQLWELKKNKKQVSRNGYSDHEYKKNNCDNASLTEIVAARVESIAHRNGKEGLKITARIGKQLKGYKGLEGKESCNLIEDPIKENKLTLEKVKKVAGLLKNENYEKLSEIQSYELRIAATRHLLYGKTGNPTFDEIMESTKPIKELLASKNNSIEL